MNRQSCFLKSTPGITSNPSFLNACAVAKPTNHSPAPARANGLDKFFQVIVISRDLGIRKPDPRIFHYTLEKLQVKPDEAVHVGDSIEQDIMGAKGAGLKAVWIKDKEEEETLEEPDCIIHTITELPRIIENKFK